MIDQAEILKDICYYESEVNTKNTYLEKLYCEYNEVVRKRQNAALEWEIWALKFEKTDRINKCPEYWRLVRTFSQTERLLNVAQNNENSVWALVGKAKKDYDDAARMLELVVNLHTASLTYEKACKIHSELKSRMENCEIRFEKMIQQKDLLLEHIEDLREETSLSCNAEAKALSELIFAEDQLEAYRLICKRES